MEKMTPEGLVVGLVVEPVAESKPEVVEAEKPKRTRKTADNK